MKAFLLAAGKGKRLRPLTFQQPKPIIPIAGISLLDYYLMVLKLLGISEITVLVGHLADKVVNHVELSGIPVRPEFAFQKEQLGTGHAVSLLKDFASDEDFLLIYSDVFISLNDLKRLLEPNLRSQLDHVVAVAEVEEPWKFGVVVEEGGLLKRIEEKPPKGKEPSNMVIAGAFLFKKKIFSHMERLSKSSRGEYELTDAIQEAASSGERVGILRLEGGWTDAGTFFDLLKASRLLFDEILGQGLYSIFGFERKDDVISKGYKGAPQFRVKGPTFIGNGVRIGEGSSIGPYVVLCDEACVEEGAEVSRSIVFEGASVGRGASIELSILGARCEVGKGARLKRRPRKGEFGLVLAEKAKVPDFAELEPGTILE